MRGRSFAALGALAVSGCVGNNDPPDLNAINGREVRNLFGQQFVLEPLTFVPGEALPIELDAEDPNGDHIRVWWPDAPVGWSFDPDQTSGVWYVPAHWEAVDFVNLVVVLQDDAPVPEARSIFLGFQNDAVSVR